MTTCPSIDRCHDKAITHWLSGTSNPHRPVNSICRQVCTIESPSSE